MSSRENVKFWLCYIENIKYYTFWRMCEILIMPNRESEILIMPNRESMKY